MSYTAKPLTCATALELGRADEPARVLEVSALANDGVTEVRVQLTGESLEEATLHGLLERPGVVVVSVHERRTAATQQLRSGQRVQIMATAVPKPRRRTPIVWATRIKIH